MRILVLGASGATGGAVVDQAIALGHEVTAFVRDAATYDGKATRVIAGDARTAADVDAAVQGQDGVVDALGGSTPWKETGLEPDAATNIVDAMRRHHVRRLVVISALGVRESEDNAGFFYAHVLMPTLLRGALKDKTRMEENLEAGAGDLDWVLVRPAALTNGDAVGRIRVFTSDEGTAGSISRNDVAAFMLRQLTDDTYLRRAVTIAAE